MRRTLIGRARNGTIDRGSGPRRTRRSRSERASSPVALEQIEERLEPGPQDRVDIALHPHADRTATDRPGQRHGQRRCSRQGIAEPAVDRLVIRALQRTGQCGIVEIVVLDIVAVTVEPDSPAQS
jgi:hypothetical protein